MPLSRVELRQNILVALDICLLWRSMTSPNTYRSVYVSEAVYVMAFAPSCILTPVAHGRDDF